MKHIKFTGNYYDIGLQHGRIYRENGLKLDKVKVSPMLPEQIAVYKKFYPEILEELRGIAEGGNFDKEKIMSIYLCGEIHWYRQKLHIPACTIFGIKTKGDILVGRNLDWIPITKKVMEIYDRHIPGKFRFTGISDMLIGSEYDVKNKFLFHDSIDGLNEKGLYIGITFAYCDRWRHGISWRDVNKYIMENCENVDQALAVFRRIPLSIPKNFFIADTERMVVVEHTSEQFRVLESDLLIKTNHYLDPELKKEDTILKHRPAHSTYVRYYKTLQKINSYKEINYDDLLDILKVSFQDCEFGSNIKTIWSLTLDMKNKMYEMHTDEKVRL